jgi:hypothetical protein
MVAIAVAMALLNMSRCTGVDRLFFFMTKYLF